MAFTLKQNIIEGLVQDQRGQLPGFEKPITSKKEKKLTEAAKEKERAYAKQHRLARKEAEEKQAQFQALKDQLKKEGKL